MKAAVILSFVALALAGVVEKRECAGNNCKRQVTGTRAGLLPITSRQADCSSFMQKTVIPDATTVTVTVTADYYLYEDEEETATEAETATIEERNIQARATTQIPTAVPAYASSCTNVAEYSSACSCWGITAVTTTAPQPTATETVTITEDSCENIWG